MRTSRTELKWRARRAFAALVYCRNLQTARRMFAAWKLWIARNR